jgi:hypothetical protein
LKKDSIKEENDSTTCSKVDLLLKSIEVQDEMFPLFQQSEESRNRGSDVILTEC